MKLLSKENYDKVEKYLREYKGYNVKTIEYIKSIEEIINFFVETPYKDFLNIFYFDRREYKNRYPSNRLLFRHLCKTLYLQEPTLYIIRKEIVYKSAMIFYKNGILK